MVSVALSKSLKLRLIQSNLRILIIFWCKLSIQVYSAISQKLSNILLTALIKIPYLFGWFRTLSLSFSHRFLPFSLNAISGFFFSLPLLLAINFNKRGKIYHKSSWIRIIASTSQLLAFMRMRIMGQKGRHKWNFFTKFNWYFFTMASVSSIPL